MRESRCVGAATEAVRRAGIELKNLSSYLKGVHRDTQDPRALRAELMLEELGESLEAMAENDELLLLDGLADLLYVAVGTATTFALPVEAAFTEVHRSNMSKEPRIQHSAGVTGKGPGFKPPDLRRVLNLARRTPMCDRCSWAHGDIRGGRVVELRQVGSQRLCVPCREALE